MATREETTGIIPIDNSLNWEVWRQDDNSNLFLMTSGLSKQRAIALAKEYEAKGHKQKYFVKIQNKVAY